MKIHNLLNPDVYFFVRCTEWYPTHTPSYTGRFYAVFFFRHFFNFSELIFCLKLPTLPCHLRYEKEFVKIPRGLDISSIIL